MTTQSTLQYIHPFTNTFIHWWQARRCHERCWHAHQKQFGVQYLTQGYFNVQLREIERATFWLLDDPLNLLSYRRYGMITTRKKLFMYKFLTDTRATCMLIIYPFQAMKANICTTFIGTLFISLVLLMFLYSGRITCSCTGWGKVTIQTFQCPLDD